MPKSNSTAADKLKSLRAEFNTFGIDGFIIPKADEHQGEFIGEYAERLQFLTDFTGSAGSAIVLKDKAVAMSDGRYTIQLKQQVDTKLFETQDSTKISVGKWLVDNADKDAVIGYDPMLHTPGQIAAMERDVAGTGITLKAVNSNPVDNIWDDQPNPPQGQISQFPDSIAGHSVTEKKKIVMDMVAEEDASGCVITLPDSVCWLLNIRGSDVGHTPLVLSNVILNAAEDKIELFIDPAKLPKDIEKTLKADIDIYEPKDMATRLQNLSKVAKKLDKPVLLDFVRSPIWYKNTLENEGGTVQNAKDPCINPKAQKTSSEQDAIRNAHVEDGVAIVKFLRWLDENTSNTLTEMDVADKLEDFRSQGKNYREMSFPTISGFADNGAVIHYRATAKTNADIDKSGLLLVDSGGQYEYGTTDITRTMAIGEPTEEMRENYTRVLRGHIAVSMAKFPKGTTGAQLDALARAPLWNAGLDFAHGTGHGVGCYLGVHEEATSISSRGTAPMEEGMLVSNEPGYYKEGEYGIRIENLILVKEGDACADTGRLMYHFETVTLAPYERSLIKSDMLAPDEKEWLNDYHKQVFDTLSPELDGDDKNWLKIQTQPF